MATTIAVKTKQRQKRETTAYNELAVRQNNGILDYSRTSMASLSGAAAGILGLTALYGFAFYFIMAFVLSLFLLMKAGTGWNKFFISRNDLITKGLFGGLFSHMAPKSNPYGMFITMAMTYFLGMVYVAFKTYVLCWTFLYGMVHVY